MSVHKVHDLKIIPLLKSLKTLSYGLLSIFCWVLYKRHSYGRNTTTYNMLVYKSTKLANYHMTFGKHEFVLNDLSPFYTPASEEASESFDHKF